MTDQADLLHSLETHFLGSLTQKIGDFMAAGGTQVQLVPLEEEQPLQNQQIFMEYQEMIEKEICSFAAEKGIQEEEIISLCKPSEFEEGQYCALTCIEYLLAMTEYASFMQLVSDHRDCQQWEYGDELGGLEEDEE
eukprot:TRINITY_DN19146_c1_g1_i3.p2 TRINITY_DN19146_c1_g1~~TRINITY_DN19146_c1_g1_i3.p2  ORF type:complete len:152 (+),score=39.42 TRINITY_DN19146_c1_g1_i3:49-456(+)